MDLDMSSCSYNTFAGHCIELHQTREHLAPSCSTLRCQEKPEDSGKRRTRSGSLRYIWHVESVILRHEHVLCLLGNPMPHWEHRVRKRYRHLHVLADDARWGADWKSIRINSMHLYRPSSRFCSPQNLASYRRNQTAKSPVPFPLANHIATMASAADEIILYTNRKCPCTRSCCHMPSLSTDKPRGPPRPHRSR